MYSTFPTAAFSPGINTEEYAYPTYATGEVHYNSLNFGEGRVHDHSYGSPDTGWIDGAYLVYISGEFILLVYLTTTVFSIPTANKFGSNFLLNNDTIKLSVAFISRNKIHKIDFQR